MRSFWHSMTTTAVRSRGRISAMLRVLEPLNPRTPEPFFASVQRLWIGAGDQRAQALRVHAVRLALLIEQRRGGRQGFGEMNGKLAQAPHRGAVQLQILHEAGPMVERTRRQLVGGDDRRGHA